MTEEQINLFNAIHKSMANGIRNGKADMPKKWLSDRKLTIEKTGACFNSGQLHHRKPIEFIEKLIEIGFLKVSPVGTNTGKPAHTSFGNYSVVFPLKNKEGQVVNFFAVGIKNNKSQYLNENGVYPCFPNADTKVVYITPNILMATALIESGLLDNREALLALDEGTIYLKHLEAIEAVRTLEKIILIRPHLNSISFNEVSRQLLEHFHHKEVIEIQLEQGQEIEKEFVQYGKEWVQEKLTIEKAEYMNNLEVVNEHKLLFRTTLLSYFVLGNISQDMGTLCVTLLVEDTVSGRKERTKIDLYEPEQVDKLAEKLSEHSISHIENIKAELLSLADLLERHREKQIEIDRPTYKSNRVKAPISHEQQEACKQFLREPNLINRIDALLEKSGIVGEELTRKLLYVIASTYKTASPLHAIVMASSGSGKSHLVNAISQCMPEDDVISMTRVTSKSFYHFTNDELVDKLVLIQDWQGLDKEAQYAFRELQSFGSISSSITFKDRNGNLQATVKTVRGHFSSMVATTAEIYIDNVSRSIIAGLDESEAQTKRIIDHQNKKLAGLIDASEEFEAKRFLQNCMRCFSKCDVVNPYAEKITLPMEAKMQRRLNNHFHAFIKQITWLHQFQREKDSLGRLIATKDDVVTAIELFVNAVVLKTDDLDPTLRQFFDRLKKYLKAETATFSQREIRIALHIGKTQSFRYMEELQRLEYIKKIGGHKNKGFHYKILYWDDLEKVREQIKNSLSEQLKELN
jgi:hypothetical protein